MMRRELRALPQFYREMQDRQFALAKVGASDHVVLEPITAPHRFLFHRDVSSTDVTEIVLEQSRHVATLDHDAERIFDESHRFIGRHAPSVGKKGSTSGG